MNNLILASIILALMLYVPLCVHILKGTAEQNFATWILWAALDGVAATTILVQNGNSALPWAYTVGSSITALCILKSKNFSWTWFETFVTVLVVVCLIVWYFSGARVATIVSSIAMVVAGLPQLGECITKPEKNPFFIWVGYATANVLSVAGAKGWTVEERFYPTAAAIYCVALAIFTSRKFWMKPANATIQVME